MTWDVTVYDGDDERETVRGLTAVQKDTLLSICRREAIRVAAKRYDDDGSLREYEHIGVEVY